MPSSYKCSRSESMIPLFLPSRLFYLVQHCTSSYWKKVTVRTASPWRFICSMKSNRRIPPQALTMRNSEFESWIENQPCDVTAICEDSLDRDVISRDSISINRLVQWLKGKKTCKKFPRDEVVTDLLLRWSWILTLYKSINTLDQETGLITQQAFFQQWMTWGLIVVATQYKAEPKSFPQYVMVL